ncbi:hypothetical protein WR25_20668 [Diploscapter pachys]|uniref:glutaminase n=1 Tax=Diploscapter pachys TaxID=2018661 RepID=A0A2A2J5K9_9BILA|nr:hypothetical protein WR25_20668 [Diploscapter pachys]
MVMMKVKHYGQAGPDEHSEKTLASIGEILNRKASVAQILTKTAEGLRKSYEMSSERSPADLIFELFKLPNREEASISRLIKVLKSFGLREKDPRFRAMMTKIKFFEESDDEQSSNSNELSRHQFKECINPAVTLISQALRNQLIIPCWHDFCAVIKTIFEEVRDTVNAGDVATYIPQLARQDPNRWGMSICTIDGQRFSLGDAKDNFCIQSVSKAFNYSIVASDLGADYVHSFIGHEPSGRLFNEICLDGNGKPHNPMINAGAIITSSLIKNGLNMADRFDFVLNEYRKIAGGEHSLREELDLYFQLCSLETNCDTLAVMASTLANGGVCPLTEERCISPQPCRDVLSLMYSCGMYDLSGKFAFQVGLPAKSGVSGAMIVVIPNLMGIALWAPPLDKMGNSCKGVAFCRKLIEKFNFHNYDSLLHADSHKIDPRRRVVGLLFAAKNGDIDVVKRLYMQGTDLDIADYDGRTALHIAASEGHAHLVRFFLNVAKVYHEPRDRWGRTPLDDAKMFHHGDCVDLLMIPYMHDKMARNTVVEENEGGSDLSMSESDDDSEMQVEQRPVVLFSQVAEKFDEWPKTLQPQSPEKQLNG